MNTPILNPTALRAWAEHDARLIRRLIATLARADVALAHCGVPKRAEIRRRINKILR